MKCKKPMRGAVVALAIFGLFAGVHGTRAAVTVTPVPGQPIQPTSPRIVPHAPPRQTAAEREAEEREAPPKNRPAGTTGAGVTGMNERETAMRKQTSRNPHVHATKVETHVERAAVRLAEDRKFARDHANHVWHRHWDYAVWLEYYSGRGRIHGVVHDAASGDPVAGARVWLRDANGRVLHFLSERHVTFSNDVGAFTMRHVHRGVYSVRTTVSGHAANGDGLVAVRPSQTSFASVHVVR